MKKFFILILFILPASVTFAQKVVNFEDEPSFKDRIFTGGGLGFGAGSGYFSVSLSPLVGYMITSKWSAGVGVNYQYVKYKSPPNLYEFSDNQWGGRLFTRYNVYQPIFLQAEYEFINYTSYYRQDGENERDIQSRYLLGGGISQPLGRKGAINIVALYDLGYDESNTSYDTSPWVFRIYFSF